MARPKKVKEIKHYTIDKESKSIVILKKDLFAISNDEKEEISFYEGIGYNVELLTELPTPKKKTFTIKKAEQYIINNANSKLKTFRAFKKDADKLADKYKELYKAFKEETGEKKPTEAQLKKARTEMVVAERDAYKEMKLWFIDQFGKEAYDEVRLEY